MQRRVMQRANSIAGAEQAAVRLHPDSRGNRAAIKLQLVRHPCVPVVFGTSMIDRRTMRPVPPSAAMPHGLRTMRRQDHLRGPRVSSMILVTVVKHSGAISWQLVTSS
jgi:hypothetical protein